MACLLDLSAEVMELIVSFLDFPAMCKLRLVSRSVSAKATHGVVESDFQNQYVFWTCADQMEALVAKTAKGWRGCLMKRLTVIGAVTLESISPCPSPSPSGLSTITPEERGEASLNKAFINIRRHAPHCLTTLALRTQRRTRNGHMAGSSDIRPVNKTWDASAQTFAATMRALTASGMPILRLDIFGSDSPRCALACDCLVDTLATLNQSLGPSMCTLTHLTIGMSNALATQWRKDLRQEQKPAFALLSLVTHCPSLTNLEVRWYDLGTSGVTDQQNGLDVAILSQLVGTSTGRSSLQRLVKCRLRGIYTTEAALLAYVQSTSCLQNLSLEEIHLSEGTFSPIFRFLSDTSNSKHLRQVYLNDLWEGAAHLRFDGPGKPHFPSTGDAKPHYITWLASSRPKHIQYIHSKGRTLGSYAFNNWRRRRAELYGPPNA